MEGLTGRRLRGGEYEIREVIARGGQATVYRAYSRTRDTDVAVKVLAPHLARDSGFRERFLGEFRSLARLHHENIVELYDYGVEGELVYIVMRLVAGGTLKDRLSVLNGPVDLVTVGRLVGQIAAGLEEAHVQGYVHLDIKPANILLGRADWPLLTDFGITQAIGRERTEKGGQRLAGTPLYMSPEQSEGGPVDGQSDQYSLAVTTFELLTRQLPFQATTTENLLEQHRYMPPPRPRELNPGIPEPVETVLLRGLAKDPDERYPSIRAFGDALAQAVEETRGVSLETKAAVAGIVPMLLGVSTALLLTPLALGSLPTNVRFAGTVPLAWPFGLLIGVLVFAALARVRWHLIGLVIRALNGVVDGARVGHGDSREKSRWTKGVAALGEGLVDLAYLGLAARMVGARLIEGAGFVSGPTLELKVGVLVTVVLLVLGLGVVARAGRLGGGLVAVGLGEILVGGAVWLGPALLGTAGTARSLEELGSVAAFPLLFGVRRPLRQGLAGLAAGLVVPLQVEVRQLNDPRAVAILAKQVQVVVGAVVDLVLGVAILALLRLPLEDVLARVIAPASATIVAVSVLVLLALALALHVGRVSGRIGVAASLLLEAPLLYALSVDALNPLYDRGLTSLDAWAIAAGSGLMVILLRGTLRGLTETTLGARLERGMVGTVAAARREEDAEQRVGAGRVIAGAIVDLALLGIGDWIVAPVLAGQFPGSPWVETIFEVFMLALAGLILGLALHRARQILENTGANDEAGRLRVLTGAGVALAALLLFGSSETVSMAFAAPEVVGLANPPAAAPHLIVRWQFWRPETPRLTEATYDVALACSDGTWLGEFREAVAIPSGTAMPHGSIGGDSSSDCADWRSVYQQLRHQAGVTAPTSVSRDWLDARITLNADGSADVTETQRVLFTAGQFDHLDWSIDLPPGTSLSNVVVQDGDPATASSPPRTVRMSGQGNQEIVAWSFPNTVSPAERTFTLRYRLLNATVITSNGREVVIPLTPGENHGPVWIATASIDLPTNVDVRQVQLDSGTQAARHEIIDGRTAWFEARDLASGASLTIRVGLPGTPPPTNTATSTSAATTVPPPLLAAVVPSATRSPTPTPSPEPSVTSEVSPTETTPAAPTLTPTVNEATTTTATLTAVTAVTRVRASLTPTLSATPGRTPTSTEIPPSATSSPTATSASVCTGDERMTFSPANPVAGQPLTIEVTASRGLPNIVFQGRYSPGGEAVSPQGPTVQNSASGVEWDWQLTPASPGRLDFYFFVQTSTLCTTNGVTVSPAPSTVTPTPTKVPTATPTWTNTPSPSATSTFTPTATVTPCPALANPVIAATGPYPSPVSVTWRSTGGCAPYSGTISAQYIPFYGTPTSRSGPIPISSQSGNTSDAPPQGCWSTITYTLNLKDRTGSAVTASSSTRYCPG